MHRPESRSGRGECSGCGVAGPDAEGGIHLTRAEIDALRREISEIDSKILKLAAKRMDAAIEIGLVKEKDGLETRDRQREKDIKAEFVARARPLGLDPTFAEILAELLISRSVRAQMTSQPKKLRGMKALVIGGSGRMGGWFCRWLSNRGASVSVWDPRRRLPGYRNIGALSAGVGGADLIVVASPPGACSDDLKAVTDLSPRGLVFDISSVKAHLAKQLSSAAKDGVKITSVHPMFGPNAPNPRGFNVIICDCGSQKANKEAESLFRGSGASVMRTSLRRHDSLMANVLVTPHASVLLFASALSASGFKLEDLVDAAGPSFERMLWSAKELSKESVRVYHDIQELNPETKHVYQGFERTLASIHRAALKKDPAEFRRIMLSIRNYVGVS